MGIQQVNVGSAGTDLTNWDKLTTSTGPHGASGAAQLARICVRTVNQAPASAFNVDFVLVDEANVVLAAFHLAVTAHTTLTRDVLTGATGNYLCDAVFDESGNSKLDLSGAGLSNTGQTSGGSHWRVGVGSYASSGVTSCIVSVIPILDV